MQAKNEKMFKLFYRVIIRQNVRYRFSRTTAQRPSAYPAYCIFLYLSLNPIIETRKTREREPTDKIGNMTDTGISVLRVMTKRFTVAFATPFAPVKQKSGSGFSLTVFFFLLKSKKNEKTGAYVYHCPYHEDKTVLVVI